MIKVNPENYKAAREALKAGVWVVDPNFGLRYPDGRIAGYVNTSGYYQVAFTWHGRRRFPFTHRIVWESFHEPIPEGLFVNHINGNKLDNSIGNLELVTPMENMIHAAATGLLHGSDTDRQALAMKIYREAWESGDTAGVVAERNGVGAHFVAKVKYGRRYAYFTKDIAVTPVRVRRRNAASA